MKPNDPSSSSPKQTPHANTIDGAGHADTSSENLEHAHTHEAIAARINDQTQRSYLRDFVFAAIDGTVTTFAVVSGVAGAGLSSEIIVILGAANLVGDGFSMAAGNFLGTRTEQQLVEKARAMERRHIRLAPEGEREEVRQIYAAKGFTGNDLEKAVEIITSNEDRWVETMLVDELGLSPYTPSPIRAAITTYVAFFFAGAIPLLSFFYGVLVGDDSPTLYFTSTLLTCAAFFLIGATKSLFIDQSWWKSGLETLGVGAIAAGLAWTIGAALGGLA